MKLLERRSPDRNELLQIGNHLFFITALLFVAHQNILQPVAVHNEAPMITQALNLQPRTPPPAYDADQLSGNEIDTAPSGDTTFHGLGERPGLTNLTPAGAALPAHAPGGRVLTRENAPDREARALPARMRPE